METFVTLAFLAVITAAVLWAVRRTKSRKPVTGSPAPGPDGPPTHDPK